MSEPVAPKRIDGWEDAFAAFIENRRNLPFAWGSNDCLVFCRDAVEAITGVRLMEPTWSTAKEGMRALVEAGGPEAAVSSVLGRGVQNYAEARRGDLVLAEQGNRRVTMVCLGAQLAGPGVERLEFKPLREAVLVWRVG